MRVLEVSNQDGIRCANLINFLKRGRWDMSGSDAEELGEVRRWLSELAIQMAHQLKTPEKAIELPGDVSGGFKVKAMGPIGSPQKKSKKKK